MSEKLKIKPIKSALPEKALDQNLYDGLLLNAKTLQEKAYLIYQHHKKEQFFVEFNHKTYWVERDKKQKGEIAGDLRSEFQSYSLITEIANCLINFLYTQRKLEGNELAYIIEIVTRDRHNISTFLPKDLASIQGFNTGVINTTSGATFEGNLKQLATLYKHKTKGVFEISAINFIGYASEFSAYVYKDFAVQNGKVFYANKYEYIELPNNVRIKTTFELDDFAPSMVYQNNWLEDYLDVFGEKGLLLLAYWLGSLFAEQIRSIYKAYPFLELTGDPAAGKSMILTFLWALLGRHDYEGWNPNNVTEPNYLRTLAQVGNLPVVMIECEGSRLERLKSAFGGGILRATAKNDLSNETISPIFRGSLVVSQNERVITQGSKLNQEALLSRLVYVHFDKSRHTPERALKADRLNQIPTEELSGFLVEALKKEPQIMKSIRASFDNDKRTIMGSGAIGERIGLTHGLMLSLVEALTLIIPLSGTILQEVRSYICQLAVERELELIQEHPVLEQFWDVFEALDAQGWQVNHSANNKLIAINLPRFHAEATKGGYQLADLQALKKLLPVTTRYKFIENNKNTYSRFSSENGSKMTLRCYTFET